MLVMFCNGVGDDIGAGVDVSVVVGFSIKFMRC